jgi:GNAT superfamily N-acetyltransferase
MVSHLQYSKFATLRNGRKVEIRPPREEDRSGLVSFLQRTSHGEVQFCKEDIKSPMVLDDWLGTQDSRRTIPLVAIDLEESRPVGSINLRCGQYADLKVGDIQQIVVDKVFQGLGLGSLLLDSLIYLALKARLNWLKAEVVTDLKAVVRAFESRGFKTKVILEDYFVDLQGNTYDVILLMLSLAEMKEDF